MQVQGLPLLRFPLALLMAALLLAAGPAARAGSGLTPLTVALPDGPPTRLVGYIIAEKRGYFADAGLAVTFVRPAYGRTPVDDLGSGRADLAIDIMPVALAAREHGRGVVHVAQVFQQSTLEIACRPAIDRPTALAGHNVGVWLGGWESPFYAWLSRLGLSHFGTGDGVTIIRQGTGPVWTAPAGAGTAPVPAGPDASDQGDAGIFFSNEVDCLTTTTYLAPLQLAALGPARAGLVTYRYRDLDLGMLEDGLYAREGDLRDAVRVEAFARFLSALVRGWQGLHDDPTEAQRLLAQDPAVAGLDPALVAESLAAVDEALETGDVEIGTLDASAYDRTVLLLMTGAPDPTLSAAPAGAISDLVRRRREAPSGTTD